MNIDNWYAIVENIYGGIGMVKEHYKDKEEAGKKLDEVYSSNHHIEIITDSELMDMIKTNDWYLD